MSTALLLTLSLSAPQENAPVEPRPPDPRDRYERTELPLTYPDAVRESAPPVDELIGMFGRFVRAQAGETLELAAVRLGFDAARARRIHGLEPGHLLEDGERFLVERYHRFLPGESLAVLGELYEVGVDDLREWNDLADGTEPAAWSRVHVPATFGERTMLDQELRTLIVLLPSTAELGFGRLRFELERHEVAEGETWANLSECCGVEARALQRLNHRQPAVAILGQPPTESGALVAGREVLVGVTMTVPDEMETGAIAILVDYLSSGRLHEVVARNGLDAPEGLEQHRTLRLPLNSLVVTYARSHQAAAPKDRR